MEKKKKAPYALEYTANHTFQNLCTVLKCRKSAQYKKHYLC